jgi:hypothetical protein
MAGNAAFTLKKFAQEILLRPGEEFEIDASFRSA